MPHENPRVTRTEFLSIMAASVAGVGAFSAARLLAQAPARSITGAEQRIAEVIRAYDLQGIHRTATPVDDESAPASVGRGCPGAHPKRYTFYTIHGVRV